MPGMTHPYDALSTLPPVGTFAEYARDLVRTNLVCDPWADGQARFDAAPLVMEPALARHLADATRRAAAAWAELCGIVWNEPELLTTFFGLTPWQKHMWLASGGWWHGFARFDAFFTTDGDLRICELNADTPSGQSDIVACSRVVGPRHPDHEDPNAAYLDRLVETIRAMFSAQCPDRELKTVGIVYPTEITEDISLILTYEACFEEAGWTAVRGSPFNLVPTPDGGVAMFGRPLDVVLRHYKTDWWGERVPARYDMARMQDPDPLPQLPMLTAAEAAGRVLAINPFGAMVAQDKRAMALFWERFDRFSPQARATITELIPPTWRLCTVGRERAEREREHWVLKSDFGCEGEEVVIGPHTTDAEWRWELRACMADRWILQEYFEPAALPSGRVPNWGLYVIGGEPAGLYVRLSKAYELTGHHSLVATPLVAPPTIQETDDD